MSQIIIDNQRVATMRERLGSAALSLIDSDKYLTLFRSRQISYSKEFEHSIKMVKSIARAGKIKNVKRYFAKIWSVQNIDKTLKIVREFLERQKAKLRERNLELAKLERQKDIAKNTNQSDRAKFKAMRAALFR